MGGGEIRNRGKNEGEWYMNQSCHTYEYNTQSRSHSCSPPHAFVDACARAIVCVCVCCAAPWISKMGDSTYINPSTHLGNGGRGCLPWPRFIKYATRLILISHTHTPWRLRPTEPSLTVPWYIWKAIDIKSEDHNAQHTTKRSNFFCIVQRILINIYMRLIVENRRHGNANRAHENRDNTQRIQRRRTQVHATEKYHQTWLSERVCAVNTWCSLE